MRGREKRCLWTAAGWAVILTILAPHSLLAQAKAQFWREGPLLAERSSGLVRLNQSLTQLVALVQPAVVQIGV
ncbi:MAG: hypothetical protein V3U42_02860 [candidate division NC10 bacterium]